MIRESRFSLRSKIALGSARYLGLLRHCLAELNSFKGILVRFSEEFANNDTLPSECQFLHVTLFLKLGIANTPWIALVSCDRNATNASMEEDIFTLARDRGAVAAVSALPYL